MARSKNITIIGAGLVGSLLALSLRKKGYEVSLYEKRDDMRSESLNGGKSINLVLTAKGVKALKDLGLYEDILEITTPVIGRMMHSISGDLTFQPYGRDKSERNLSVSRGELNKLLMNKAESFGTKITFNEELSSIDFDKNIIKFKSGNEYTFQVLLGADGAGSLVRKNIKNLLNDSMTLSQEPLGISYKELSMPAKNGEYPLQMDCLHIWPRGSHMLMALANLDSSFTMTLYMPDEDFTELDSREKIRSYFAQNYPDALDLMPEYISEFIENPNGFLGTIRCWPWNNKKVALIGDAAHAIVPFFGQGTNCGFNDVSTLLDLLDSDDSWEAILEQYCQIRKPNADAIANMSIDNCKTMSSRVGDQNFLFKKSVEYELEKRFPNEYRSRYALVTYTLVDYFHDEKIGEIQEEILETLCKNKKLEDINFDLAKQLIERKLIPYYKEHNLNLERFQF